MCNCICMELYENIKEEKAVTSPVRRTPPPSIAVAMETVRREALSSHRPQTGKLRPRKGGFGPIAWTRKRLLSPITTLWGGDLFCGLWD